MQLKSQTETDAYMRLSSNSAVWSRATYNDFGYFKPNPSDFTMTMKLRILTYLSSELTQLTPDLTPVNSSSYLIMNFETGGSLLKLRFNENGIQCLNSLNEWESVSTDTSIRI